ncbi:UPF0692 protein C19orf54 homolog [Actinia tenebrosa]|uniref:Actin maturation protease n=1 Tax=Actinia tenebrosa TaxID=6105 RepID=A0A6P8IKJ3_ACTTE|nr:UPF0692 protein C19orf54 homolog [Actinia tenebrosa]
MSAIPEPAVPPPPTKQDIKTKRELMIAENEESSRIKGIEEQCKKIVVQSLESTKHEGIAHDHWVLFNVDVRPKLQGSAPRCGLVALSMAAEMARISREGDKRSHLDYSKNTLRYDDDDNDESELTAIVNLAKSLSFTSEGEMFSARNLATLAHKFYDLKTLVTENSFDDIQRIIDHLLRGNPLLVPYDAAPNHEPCLLKGRKSHWALLTGFLCAVDGSAVNCLELKGSNINVDFDQNVSTIHVIEKPGAEIQRFLLNNMIHSTIYLLARQPKSRHVAIWSLNSLQESNSNLFELNDNKENAQSFVIPDGGVYEGLCKKLIYLNY